MDQNQVDAETDNSKSGVLNILHAKGSNPTPRVGQRQQMDNTWTTLRYCASLVGGLTARKQNTHTKAIRFFRWSGFCGVPSRVDGPIIVVLVRNNQTSTHIVSPPIKANSAPDTWYVLNESPPSQLTLATTLYGTPSAALRTHVS